MSGKNRKYGRNSKRSHSMSRYRAEDRAARNKRLKFERHQRSNPTDKTKLGEVPKFPAIIDKRDDVKPSMTGSKQGYTLKDGSIIIPATMFRVVSAGVTLEYSHLLSEAEKAYADCRGQVALYSEVSGSKKVISSKRAAPVMSDKALAVAAYGDQRKPNVRNDAKR